MNDTIGDPVLFVESRFGIKLSKVSRAEYSGPCPWCGGTDRFRIWRDRGNYYCRPNPGHCGRAGWLDELDDVKPLTEVERLAARVSALERKAEEHEARLSALEKMHKSSAHLLYHKNLADTGAGADYWLSEGMTSAILRHKLGYCESCPTAPGQASYTIPVMYDGKLWNIRHRLASPNGSGKYRPHMAGLPSMIFNANDLRRKDAHELLILEGEKKSMIVTQETGRANIAVMGMQNFKPEWAAKVGPWFRTVYVAYDPDATEKAAQVAALFGARGRVVDLPVKADDFFVRYGGTAAGLANYIDKARPV